MLVITATNLPRFMACEGSRLMPESYPADGGNDEVRNEGNAAHWVVQQVHSGQHTADELIDQKSPEGVYITPEMVEFLDQYLVAVMTPNTLIEHDTSHGSENWHIPGRADLIRYDAATAHLTIGDLKYGWSIVEPYMNWTLIDHAIGFMRANPNLPVQNITFVIYQPRPHHPGGRVREWTISAFELSQLANMLHIKMNAPTDELRTSDHCRNCPALATCPAARKAQMNVIDMTESHAFNDQIDNGNLAFQLDQLKRAGAFIKEREKACQELATYRLRQGQIIENYSLETELTNRAWRDEVSPELMTALTGKDLTKKTMITPAQVEKLGVPKEAVQALTERHNKGVKLVRVDANTKAQKMFNPKG